MKTIIQSIALLFLLTLVSCGESHKDENFRPVSKSVEEPVFDGKGIDVSKLAPAEKIFIPTTSPSLYDANYMNQVKSLIEKESKSYSTDTDFIKVVKSIAWKESHWTHYYLEDDAIFLLMGDNGSSLGMFQIYTRYHPELPEIVSNTQYAIELAWKIFKNVKTDPCRWGTNKGKDKEALLRRVYATYNGGTNNTCRNGDGRDDNFVNIFKQRPWEVYL